ncbi:MAG: hypothetical protein E5W60_22700, partial [Mesorhizobium sp.]
MSIRFKALLAGIAAASTSMAAAAQDAKGPLYLLVPNVTTARFAQFDIPNITAALKEKAPGAKLVVLNANDDMQQQVSQADAALSSGAAGIILVAVDPL